MMTITEQELRECPFCGDKPVFNTYQDESNFSHNIVTFYQIYCGCMPNPDFSIENKQEVIEEWNTRAYDAEFEELRKCKVNYEKLLRRIEINFQVYEQAFEKEKQKLSINGSPVRLKDSPWLEYCNSVKVILLELLKFDYENTR